MAPGQVLVLGCVTLLIMALMLMLSFSLTQAIHEKIRLQQHSDAMAYSMATVEARGMNYFAYSNRAIAAAAVSEMTLHAYYSTVTMSADTFQAAYMAFLEIVGEEFGLCAACCPACCVQHCADAFQALDVAMQMEDKKSDLSDSIEGIEQEFNQAVQAYSVFIDLIHAGQLSVIDHTSEVLMGRQLDSLKKLNAPRSSPLPEGVGALNLRNFACAMEGTPMDQLCSGGPSKSSKEARSKVISNVANAARGDWPKDHGSFPELMHPTTLDDLMQKIQSDGITMPFLDSGSAKVMKGHSSSDCTGDSNSQEGETVCGVDNGYLVSQYKHGIGFGDFSAEIYSDHNGGEHNPWGHTGQHGEWHGFEREEDLGTCLSEGECFVNFRSTTEAPFNQPAVFAYFEQDLRENLNGYHGKWELGTDGKLSLNDGEHDQYYDDPGVLDMVPRRNGAAVSKALVYFHRPDDWRMPPNMFDPYWKAKLHPFETQELTDTLGAAMNNDAVQMLSGPVEGKDP